MISIDVPADYKWVLLALVGARQRSTRVSLASIAGARASLALLTTHAQASSSRTSTSSSASCRPVKSTASSTRPCSHPCLPSRASCVDVATTSPRRHADAVARRYAPPGHKNEEAFNCAQRAHQNTVESQALFLVELVIVGLFYPLFAATCGALYSVGRILYGYGYATKGPDGRLIGSLISHLGDLPLQIAVFKLCYVAFTTW